MLFRQMTIRCLYKLYAIKRPKLRDIILKHLTKLEGGQMQSVTLRKIFADYHNIEVGMYSYGGCFCPERITGFTKIGRFCSFAEGVCIMNRNHPIMFKSTHPYFFNSTLGFVNKESIPMRSIEIGNDVWVGRNAMILPSVKKIGDGAVIGAGAVVTKDVPDFAVVAGNPATIIKYRFSPDSICQIKQSRWWDKNIEELKGNIEEFTMPLEKNDKDTEV